MDFIKEMREGDVLVKIGWIDKGTEGLCQYGEICSKITINLALLVVDTYIHELIHHRYPHLSEEEVLNKTGATIRKLTKKEIFEIFLAVMEYSLPEEE
jgi:hypothetical protein